MTWTFNWTLSRLSACQIHNLLKLTITDVARDRLRKELVRRDKERRMWYLHEQRGRDRARAEKRLRR